MLGYFPEPYPDELFYSICARYADRMQYPKDRLAVLDLFGGSSSSGVFGLPTRLKHLVASLPPGYRYTIDQLIDEHTFFPYFSPFFPKDRWGSLRETMIGRDGVSDRLISAMMCKPVNSSRYLRYCPRCVDEDRQLFGECYWHRHHQLPGVLVCSRHMVWLEHSTVKTRGYANRNEFIAAESIVQNRAARTLSTNNFFDQALLKLASNTIWLLNQHNLVAGHEFFHKRYLACLFDRKLASYSGRVHTTELKRDVQNYYSSKLLALLGCELNERSRKNWPANLVHISESGRPPIYHLLLIQFLGYTIENFLAVPPEIKPFGEGPWPCLNRASDHYLQLRVTKCNISHAAARNGRPLGTFYCDCGFAYSRMGPDHSEDDIYRIGRIKSYGSVWEARLLAVCQDSEVTLKQVAQQLGTSKDVVRRQATRLGLSFATQKGKLWITETQEHSQANHTESPTILTRHREEWLSIMKKHPGVGVAELKRKVPVMYQWLYRHDLEWLKAHTPPPQKKSPPPVKTRIDWAERDAQLAKAVKRSVQQLRNRPGRPIRITLTTIVHSVGYSLLADKTCRARLPLTSMAIAESVESMAECDLRRIQWAAKYCQRKSIHLGRYDFMKLAGVHHREKLPHVKEAVDDALEMLGQVEYIL